MQKFNRLTKLTTGAALMFALASTPTVAEDKPEPRENVVYLEMVLVDYKPGKTQRAYEIIADHFEKAGEAAGTDGPWVMHFQTGAYDAAFFWEMKEGPVEFTWLSQPDDGKWWKALSEQQGGEDKAQALMDEYMSLIAREVKSFGHHDLTKEEIAAMAKDK